MINLYVYFVFFIIQRCYRNIGCNNKRFLNFFDVLAFLITPGRAIPAKLKLLFISHRTILFCFIVKKNTPRFDQWTLAKC